MSATEGAAIRLDSPVLGGNESSVFISNIFVERLKVVYKCFRQGKVSKLSRINCFRYLGRKNKKEEKTNNALKWFDLFFPLTNFQYLVILLLCPLARQYNFLGIPNVP